MSYGCGSQSLQSPCLVWVSMPPFIFSSHRQMWKPDQRTREKNEGAGVTAVIHSWLALSWFSAHGPLSLARALTVTLATTPVLLDWSGVGAHLPPACQPHGHGHSQLWSTLCGPIDPSVTHHCCCHLPPLLR